MSRSRRFQIRIAEEVRPLGRVVGGVACSEPSRLRALELELELAREDGDELLSAMATELCEFGFWLQLDDHRHHQSIRVRGEQEEVDAFGFGMKLAPLERADDFGIDRCRSRDQVAERDAVEVE